MKEIGDPFFFPSPFGLIFLLIGLGEKDMGVFFIDWFGVGICFFLLAFRTCSFVPVMKISHFLPLTRMFL